MISHRNAFLAAAIGLVLATGVASPDVAAKEKDKQAQSKEDRSHDDRA